MCTSLFIGHIFMLKTIRISSLYSRSKGRCKRVIFARIYSTSAQLGTAPSGLVHAGTVFASLRSGYDVSPAVVDSYFEHDL